MTMDHELVPDSEDEAYYLAEHASFDQRKVIELDSEDESEVAKSDQMAVDDQEDSEELAAVTKEIQSIDSQMTELANLRKELVKNRAVIKARLKASNGTSSVSRAVKSSQAVSSVNYHDSDFPWSLALKTQIKSVWGIDKWRPIQQGVCNAVMDQRDVCCIMPTGAGKSLTFQAPALLSKGVTIVVSPLLALSSDQVFHLKKTGVNAQMISAATSQADAKAILSHLANGPADDEEEMKLLYLTPEKIAKSKTLVNALQKCYDRQALARIVIDECHCVSQQGHDFRPDYRKLNVFKTLFKKTPIVALTATCPPAVLQDILQILQLKPTTSGEFANTKGTVLFTAPLYRANLYYSVVERPSNAKELLKTMATWIKTKHPNELGIVYCLSQKDTQTTAEGLREEGIKTGIYHAGVEDQAKERVHAKWREGRLHVICCTISFGMGIDQPNVRFVIHQTPSKSLEGLYQESGRAGRDGKDADCLVYFRAGQDVSRLASLVCREVSGQAKIVDLLAYATDLRTCRKLLFSKYFDSARYDPTSASTPCKACDNCDRTDEELTIKNASPEAYLILSALDKALKLDARLTLPQLADLARGLGKGEVNVAVGEGRDKIQTKAQVAITEKVKLSKEETELLVARLLSTGYLGFLFHATAYADIAYMTKGTLATRLLRLDDKAVAAFSLEFAFPAKKKRNSKRKAKEIDEGENSTEDDEEVAPAKSAPKANSSKLDKKAKIVVSGNQANGSAVDEDEWDLIR